MPLSSLLTSILEQAKEPLHCLNGAGYFTEEEWIKLDLILNKKQTWTNDAVDSISVSEQNLNFTKSVKKLHEKEAPSQPSSLDRSRKSALRGEDLKFVAPKASEVKVLSTGHSSDADWDLAPELYSSVVVSPKQPELPTHTKLEPLNPHITGKSLAGSTKSQLEDFRNHNSGFPKVLTRETPPRLSHPKSSVFPPPMSKPTGSSLELTDSRKISLSKLDHGSAFSIPAGSPELKKREVQTLKSNITGGTSKDNHDDVNTFETRNAAEWDEPPPTHTDKNTKKNSLALSERTPEKRTKGVAVTYENKTTALSSSSPTTRSTSSVTTRESSTPLRKETKLARESSPQIKTRICWFWAISPGGCRNRAEDCVNLHVKPSPGAVIDSPLNKAKNLLQPSETSAVKSKTCWLWAMTGACEKGDKKCDHIHGWVVGGIAPRPKNVSIERKLTSGVEQKGKGEKKVVKIAKVENPS